MIRFLPEIFNIDVDLRQFQDFPAGSFRTFRNKYGLIKKFLQQRDLMLFHLTDDHEGKIMKKKLCIAHLMHLAAIQSNNKKPPPGVAFVKMLIYRASHQVCNAHLLYFIRFPCIMADFVFTVIGFDHSYNCVISCVKIILHGGTFV